MYLLIICYIFADGVRFGNYCQLVEKRLLRLAKSKLKLMQPGQLLLIKALVIFVFGSFTR